MPPWHRRAPPHRVLSANMCRQNLAASTPFLTPVRRFSRSILALVRRRWPSTCVSAADSASVLNLLLLHPARTLQADRLQCRLRAVVVAVVAEGAAVLAWGVDRWEAA